MSETPRYAPRLKSPTLVIKSQACNRTGLGTSAACRTGDGHN